MDSSFGTCPTSDRSRRRALSDLASLPGFNDFTEIASVSAHARLVAVSLLRYSIQPDRLFVIAARRQSAWVSGSTDNRFFGSYRPVVQNGFRVRYREVSSSIIMFVSPLSHPQRSRSAAA